MYKIFAKSSLHEIWGDLIVYRNLVPSDPRLPSIDALRQALSLKAAYLPRKSEPDYAVVVAEILRQARALELPGVSISRLVFIGDTQLLDGTAFTNLCAAGNWLGWVFIGRDDLQSEKAVQIEGPFYKANRWSALPDFIDYIETKGFGFDENTAVVIDMDKTAVGARGRNDRVIDEARLEGVRLTVSDLLGDEFDEDIFRTIYDELNQPAYHSFTADNQDYLAYICLVLGAGLFDFEDLTGEIRRGSLASFSSFIEQVQDRRSELPTGGLVSIHEQVWTSFQAGDPTPFKTFRRNEYLTTADRYGGEIGEPIGSVLAQRAVITQEVRWAAQTLRKSGTLVFGLSDKPDEASFPTPELAEKGMLPLHHLTTLCMGEA